MKKIQAQPYLILFGALLIFTLGAVVPAALDSSIVAPRQARIVGIPTPSEMMRIVEGTPFPVPVGKVFVTTGLGFADVGSSVGAFEIRFDGSTVLRVDGNAINNVLGVASIPPGLAASSGTTVSVTHTSGASPSLILGYLADA